MARVPFSITPNSITVDGKRIHGVIGYTLEWNAEDQTTLTLDLGVLPAQRTNGEAHVFLIGRAREGLIALGWTPPEGEGG